jgi:hypothetical protein
MSQEKVNKYKQEKANRKQILKKQKRNRMITKVVGSIVCLAIVGWIGYSAYDSTAKKIASSQTEVDLSSLQNYLSGISPEEELPAEDDAELEEDGTEDEDTEE